MTSDSSHSSAETLENTTQAPEHSAPQPSAKTSTPSMDSVQPQCYLLELPTEILQQIYSYVFPEHSLICTCLESTQPSRKEAVKFRARSFVAPLLVCKMIYLERYSIALSNMPCLRSHWKFFDLWNGIEPELRRRIRHLILHVKYEFQPFIVYYLLRTKCEGLELDSLTFVFDEWVPFHGTSKHYIHNDKWKPDSEMIGSIKEVHIVNSDKERDDEEPTTDEHGRFKCVSCIHTFQASRHLEGHKQLVHGEGGKYECEVCFKRFLRSVNRRAHFTTHIHRKNSRGRKVKLSLEELDIVLQNYTRNLRR